MHFLTLYKLTMKQINNSYSVAYGSGKLDKPK